MLPIGMRGEGSIVIVLVLLVRELKLGSSNLFNLIKLGVVDSAVAYFCFFFFFVGRGNEKRGVSVCDDI